MSGGRSAIYLKSVGGRMKKASPSMVETYAAGIVVKRLVHARARWS